RAVDAPLADEGDTAPVDEPLAFGDFVTTDPAMKKVLGQLLRVAASDATVLIEGDTGTGKELLARALHAASPRAGRPMGVVDCGAVSATLLEGQLFGHLKGAFTGAAEARAGVFEAADGGTVFLDELGELPLELQPKLLRVLEARTVRRLGDVKDVPVDVRFVAATNRDLSDMVRQGTFRQDVFFRVAVVRVRVPPLAERPGDVPLLARRYLAQLRGPDARLTEAAEGALMGYDWPGNARELRNVMERAAALAPGPEVGPEDLFGEAAPARATAFREAKDEVVAEFERRYVQALMLRHGGNVSSAARESGLSRNALYALMKRVGVDPTEPR
ncbi:MAG: sigma-54-dependent Fis family transcriptional regulator, partial [Deltaproteobacteria bacterium]|nr:sigma-54-dependent Fis family transcriptional regulator [Deltaproteobacteria bacterium]